MAAEVIQRHVRLVVAGEKFEITTTALDRVKTERSGQSQDVHGLRALHHALIRTGSKPGDWDSFLLGLESIEDLTDEGEVDPDLDPTRPAD